MLHLFDMNTLQLIKTFKEIRAKTIATQKLVPTSHNFVVLDKRRVKTYKLTSSDELEPIHVCNNYLFEKQSFYTIV